MVPTLYKASIRLSTCLYKLLRFPYTETVYKNKPRNLLNFIKYLRRHRNGKSSENTAAKMNTCHF